MGHNSYFYLIEVINASEWIGSVEEAQTKDNHFITLKENYKNLFKLYSTLESEKRDKSRKTEELYKEAQNIVKWAESRDDKELLTLVYSFLSKIQSIRS